MTAEEHNRLTEFFRDEYESMLGYVKKQITGITHLEGEDIVQEVITGFYSRSPSAAPVENIAAYIYRALKNRIIETFRKKEIPLSLDAPGDREEDLSLLNIIEDNRFDAAAEHEKKALREAIFSVIDALQPEQRLVIIATELEGKSYRELSEELDIPVGTLLSRKSRALKVVREGLHETLDQMEE